MVFKKKGFLISLLLIFVFFSAFTAIKNYSYGEEPSVGQSSTEQVDKLKEIRKKIEETQSLLEDTRKKKATLQNEITYQDNQIKLTALKVQETEQEIGALSTQINKLEGVLVDLSNVFSKRAVETYILKRLGDPVFLLLTSKNVSEFISHFHYLQKIQNNDKDLLIQMQSTQTNFEDQKAKEEALRDKLKQQNLQLGRQKAQKQGLLETTKNDEKKYQELLATLKADETAIQRAISSLISQIVAGIATGSPVTKGQVIGGQGNTGNVFPRPSSSCPECGSHLHFMVMTCNLVTNPTALNTNGGCHTNPEPYLNNSQYQKPLDYQYISQGYGNTPFAQSGTGGYNFHSGLDLVAFHGAPIYAIDNGTVYYGTDSGGGKYALVKHKDDLWSAYWHLQ